MVYRRKASHSRSDTNQKEIVKALRKIPGVKVEVNHDDFLVGFQGKTYWFECKNPDEVSKKTGEVLEEAIRPDQKELRATWTGHYKIVWTLEQILKEIGII